MSSKHHLSYISSFFIKGGITFSTYCVAYKADVSSSCVHQILCSVFESVVFINVFCFSMRDWLPLFDSLFLVFVLT